MSDSAVGKLFAAVFEAAPAERQKLIAAESDERVRAGVRRLLDRHEQLTTGTIDFLNTLDLESAIRLLDGEWQDPTTVGRFEILRRLGYGSSGVVYLARDPALDRLVALKLLATEPDLDSSAVARFETEARVASSLDHPHIVTIHEIGMSADHRPFIAMGYLGGDTLRARISGGPLDVDEALRIATEVADGLAAAHAKGVIHRDIKPENILLPDRGACIVDFGIAEIIGRASGRTGRGRGTTAYMSPEQLRGEATDHRTDIWSFGVVLHEMLTGKRPFAGDDIDGLISAITNDTSTTVTAHNPELPGALVNVLDRCLARSPDGRFASAQELLVALRGIRNRDTLTGLSAPGSSGGISRWRLFVPAVLVLAAIVSGWLQVNRSRVGPGATEGPAPGVAVLPWRVMVTGEEDLREGIVDLLSFSIEGIDGLRKIDPSTAVTAWRALGGQEQEEIDPGTAALVAERVGARYVVTGSVTRFGGEVALIAEVRSVSPNRLRGSARVTGPIDSVTALVDRLTLELLRQGLLPSINDQQPAALGSITTISLPALKAYLAGERAYRVARWQEAARHYATAVELDSTFGRAIYRLIKSQDWGVAIGDVDDELARLAPLVERLPERDRMLVRGDMGSRFPGVAEIDPLEQIELLQNLVRRFPDDVEGWVALGDRAFHDRVTLLPSTIWREAFARATKLNPHYSEPYLHLLEDAFLQRDSAAARRLLTEFGAIDRGTRCSPQLAYQAVWGTHQERRSALATLDTMSVRTLWVDCFPGAGVLPSTPELRGHFNRIYRGVIDTASGGALSLLPFYHLRMRMLLARGEFASLRRDLAELEILTDRPNWWNERLKIQLHLSGSPDPRAVAQASEILWPVDHLSGHFWIGLSALDDRRWPEAQRAVDWLEQRAEEYADEGERFGVHAARSHAELLRAYRGFLLGELKVESIDSALLNLPWLSAIDPQVTVRFLVAQRLLERNQFDDARRYFESFGPIDLVAPQAQFYLGRIAEHAGRNQEALRHYRLFIEWWHDADPEFDHLLRQAREAVLRLAPQNAASRVSRPVP